jgi:GrpB-like predicted nucleotidyltransferase (UPF0157 family)
VTPLGHVSLKPAAFFASAATEEFEEHRRRIVARVPRADARHIGGTSLSGALTKGDLDVQVRVPRRHFREAVAELRQIYSVSHSELWSNEFATFVSPSASLPEDTGISIVVIGSRFDRNGAYVWSRLASDPELLRKYNALKARHSRKPRSDYEADKDAFFAAVSAASPERRRRRH